MLGVSKLGMRFGSQLLFEEATFQCRPNQRFGITGKNGAGKSTLLEVLAGHDNSHEGEISLPQAATIGILKQDHFQYENWRVLDVVIAGKPELWDAIQQKEELFSKVEFTEEDGIKLGELEEVVAANNGYEAESFAATLLSGLGIAQEKQNGSMQALSGGFKLRVLLAQVLFQEPDLLLLDEPTNHLDITSIHWLEQYLTYEFEGILLFISHDKHFLNSVATHILDIDYDTIIPYTGNYDAFTLTKAQVEEQSRAARGQQEAKISQLREFVDKFGAKNTKAKQAKSKQKQIERMELTEVKTSNRRAPFFKFTQCRPSGKSVLKVKEISKSFGELQVLNNVSFELFRGEKVAIIGPNGMGKSTIIKIILDQLPVDQGEYQWGHEVYQGYFAQDHHEQLAGEQTVFSWLEERAPAQQRMHVRNYLGQMLLSGDDVKKRVSQLSGGEAARLLAANLIINQPNVLILDEPTNHLDLESVAALAEALAKFEGTLLFVSHDRDFVRKIASRIIVLTPQGLQDVTKSYDEYLDSAGEDYLDRNKKEAKEKPEKQPKAKKSSNKSGKKESKLQKQITELEQELLLIDEQMAAPEFYQNTPQEDVTALQQERKSVQRRIDEKLAEWENLNN
jgi:ATPase subunit of ABC transporter with duplicated ATPase domains